MNFRGFSVCACLVMLVVSSGCKRSGSSTDVEGLALASEAELAAFDPAVAEQLRAAADRASAAVGSSESAADRAQAAGHLGQLYQTYDLAEAARSCYELAEEIAPEDWKWPYLLAVVLEMGGRGAEASQHFERALELRPDHVPALIRAADGYLDRQELDMASARYDRVLTLNPGSAAALWGVGRVELRRGRPERAIESVLRALESEPAATRLHSTLAAAYRREGDLGSAALHAAQQGLTDPTVEDPLLQEILSLRTGAGAQLARGYEAAAAGSFEQAVVAYAEAVEFDPENPEARRALAGALTVLGRRDDALEQYQQVLVLEPESAVAHYNVAANLPDEASADAIELLERATAIAPGIPEFELERLARLATVGAFDAAEQGYRSILRGDPGSLGAAWGLARLATSRGDMQGARRAYDSLVSRQLADDERAELYFERGRLLAVERAGDGGLSDFERALELLPSFLEARFAVANAHGLAGRYRDAAREYGEVLSAEPDHLGARLGQATAFALDGRIVEARSSIERGLEWLPEHPALLAALQRLSREPNGS